MVKPFAHKHFIELCTSRQNNRMSESCNINRICSARPLVWNPLTSVPASICLAPTPAASPRLMQLWNELRHHDYNTGWFRFWYLPDMLMVISQLMMFEIISSYSFFNFLSIVITVKFQSVYRSHCSPASRPILWFPYFTNAVALLAPGIFTPTAVIVLVLCAPFISLSLES